MKQVKFVVALAVIGSAAAGATAHHLYENHLSSGYAPIFKAAMTGSYEERALYIHEARVAVRTNKDREVEAKLEKMQWNGGGNMSPACQKLQYIAEDKHQKFKREVAANERGEPGAYAAVMSDNDEIKAGDAVLACIDAAEKAQQSENDKLWPELRATAGLPAHD
jgi:hypothetical protein